MSKHIKKENLCISKGLDGIVRYFFTFFSEMVKDLFWSRRLFVYRIKKIISSRFFCFLDKRFFNLKEYYKTLYEHEKNTHIKKKRYGSYVFYMRRGDENMIREVSLDKDYFRLKNFIPTKGNVVLDLGAGIGDYTILSASRVGDSGLVIAVECDEKTYSLLKKNVRENKLSNVITLNIKVSNKKGTRIDDIVKKCKLRRLDIIKMDIEGYEYLALLGAKATLEKFHPKIVMEAHSTRLRNMIKKYLERFGYRLVYEDKKLGLDFYILYFV